MGDAWVRIICVKAVVVLVQPELIFFGSCYRTCFSRFLICHKHAGARYGVDLVQRQIVGNA